MLLSFIRSHVSLAREYLNLTDRLLRVGLAPHFTTISIKLLVADSSHMSVRILWDLVTVILGAMEASLVITNQVVVSTFKRNTQFLVFI